MRNITSINGNNSGSKNSFLGAYIEAQNNQHIPEEVFFVSGAILTVGLPEIFIAVYSGIILCMLFAGSLLAGGGLGLAIGFYKSPYQILSLRKETASQVPTSRNDTEKKAA